MPEKVDRCVESLMADWKSGKKKKPTQYKSGDKMKPIKGEKDLRSAAFGICQAATKKEADGGLLLEKEVEFPNPVMTGVAVTNRPHIQGLDPISVLERDGRKLLKIPLLVLGKWVHKTGILNFTSEFVAKLKQALSDKVAGHDISVDWRHKPDSKGALGWVKRFEEEVRPDGKTQVSVLAEPTDVGLDHIENKRVKYASIEFWPDFKARAAAALSTDEVESEYEDGACPAIIDLESEYPEYYKEGDMPNDKNDQVSLEQFEALQAELDKLKESADRVTQLETQLEAERTRAIRLERMAAEQFVEAIVSKAESYRDRDTRAHSKVFLDWLGNVLSVKPIGEEEDAIELEAQDSVAATHAYYRQAIAWLSENLPGAVPMAAPKSEPDKTRRIGLEQEEEAGDEARREIRQAMWSLPPGEEE